MTAPNRDRRGQLADNLGAVRARIGAAAEAAGRDPDEITLVAVTKRFPSDDVELLAQLGVTDVGENRAQEVRDKRAQVPQCPVRWHFIGQLQTNKARMVATAVDCVQTVDRLALVAALARATVGRDVPLDCLVQVSLAAISDADEHRGGCPPDAVLDVAAALDEVPTLRLGGIMGMAPLNSDPEVAFARMAPVVADVRAHWPAATVVSAGMSGDLEAAVAAGATHVRVGTALLGARPVLR